MAADSILSAVELFPQAPRQGTETRIYIDILKATWGSFPTSSPSGDGNFLVKPQPLAPWQSAFPTSSPSGDGNSLIRLFVLNAHKFFSHKLPVRGRKRGTKGNASTGNGPTFPTSSPSGDGNHSWPGYCSAPHSGHFSHKLPVRGRKQQPIFLVNPQPFAELFPQAPRQGTETGTL